LIFPLQTSTYSCPEEFFPLISCFEKQSRGKFKKEIAFPDNYTEYYPNWEKAI